jgi:hypothetical protein
MRIGKYEVKLEFREIKPSLAHLGNLFVIFKTESGYPISGYFASTLMKGENRGLALEGSRPDWTVSAEEMSLVRAAIQGALETGVAQ